ncbi:uncharacterized protein LOC106170253 [Lingula anatina]|uniref:Uncharacterized protein LOC106170253 n=1 Tax=Lingula anatina TaxID=7574 RepID=A0A1S3J539_LINAN|nr:uncharacterized protein LOC106170253 [Lingula anatina]|eukprot:XP_013405500.1 uncharacterized protein LOC106170253 [Lingula anatina]
MKVLVVLACVLVAASAVKLCQKQCSDELLKVQNMVNRPLGLEAPKCNDDGTFAAKQVRGSMSYCVDACGDMLNYDMRHRWEDHDCQCARDLDDYQQLGIVGKMYNCDKYGNYDKIQCSGSVCFCADRTGKMLQATQPVGIWEQHKLNC